jgi:hypothetical protein
VRVEVSSRRFAIPYECPCCGAVPDTELGIPLAVGGSHKTAPDTAETLQVPYCRKCLHHVARRESAITLSSMLAFFALCAGTVLALTGWPWIGLGVFGGMLPVAWFVRSQRLAAAKAAMRDSCADIDFAVGYLGWSGTTTALELSSHTYAARFAEANPQILAAVTPQLEKLLEGHRLARLAVPTPAATVTVPPPATVKEWIDRLEATSGTVARRAMLGRALDALTESGERQLVIQTVCRLEVEPIAKQLASEKRAVPYLEKAIAEARADNMPEALQAAVLYDLEGRLRTVRK